MIGRLRHILGPLALVEHGAVRQEALQRVCITNIWFQLLFIICIRRNQEGGRSDRYRITPEGGHNDHYPRPQGHDGGERVEVKTVELYTLAKGVRSRVTGESELLYIIGLCICFA